MVHEIKDKDDLEGQFKAAGDKLVVVDFHALWCGPCKRIAPFLEKLADKYADSMVVVKVDVDEVEELATKYKIQSMPTFIFFRKGSHLHTQTGSDEAKLQEAIEKFL